MPAEAALNRDVFYRFYPADFSYFSGKVRPALRYKRIPFLELLPTPDVYRNVILPRTGELLDRLSAHLTRHPYVLGRRPSLADCALMGPFYAHLYLDAVPARLLRERAPLVCHWIQRMNNPDPGSFAEWATPAELAPTLAPILALIGSDAVPLLLDNLHAFDAWAAARPADIVEPPRGVGGHATALRGAAFNRITSPYTLCMVQRPLDVYGALTPAERGEVDRYLAGSGCEALVAYRPRYRLGKRNFKLAFV